VLGLGQQITLEEPIWVARIVDILNRITVRKGFPDQEVILVVLVQGGVGGRIAGPDVAVIEDLVVDDIAPLVELVRAPIAVAVGDRRLEDGGGVIAGLGGPLAWY
jgi:hypothetical protein